MLEQDEQDRIRAWQAGLQGGARLTVVVTDHAESESLAAFADTFGRLAPRVRVSLERGSEAARPAMFVGSRLRYLAAPRGTELAPFLEAVQRFGADAPVGGGGKDSVSGATGTHVRVYVSAHCPHCPTAVRAILQILDEEPAATLTIVDAGVCGEEAAADLVKSVPTVLVGRHYRATGAVSLDEIRRALHGDQPDAPAIGRFLDAGDADAVAAMMIASGEVFPGVLDRLARETMSVRLGAMAALELVIEGAPEVARLAEAGIWDRLAGAGPQATGDLVYLLGEAGSPASAPGLEALLETAPSDDLREAVEDALARLAERAQG